MFSLINRRFENKEELLSNSQKDLNYLVSLRRKDMKRRDRSREFNLLTEYYNFILYLRTLAYHDKIDYPCFYEKSEEPDFIISDDIGIEISRVTEEEYQKWLGQIESLKGVQMYSLSGYAGNEPERLTVEEVMQRIQVKNQRLEEYRKKTSKVRLLLKIETDAILEETEFVEILRRKINLLPNCFDEISIITEGYTLHHQINTEGFKSLEAPRF